jgi:Transcription factor WhiB
VKRRKPARRERPPRKPPMRVAPSADWTVALAEILRHAPPKLNGALCPSYPARLFDGEDDRAIATVRKICSRCPARGPCYRWANAQKPGSLSGVIAGIVFDGA